MKRIIALTLALWSGGCGINHWYNHRVKHCQLEAAVLSVAACSGITDANQRSACSAIAGAILYTECFEHDND